MKIDVGLIEGYEEMTPEEKVAALESMEFDDSELAKLREEVKKNKDLITKYTGEISALKKEKNSTLTEAEAKALAQEEAFKELQSKYDEMLKSSTRSAYVTKYVELGYDRELAEETAQALVDGDLDKVFMNGEKYKATLEKQFKADALKATPKPGAGSPQFKTKEDIMKIADASERQKAIAENIELFD